MHRCAWLTTCRGLGAGSRFDSVIDGRLHRFNAGYLLFVLLYAGQGVEFECETSEMVDEGWIAARDIGNGRDSFRRKCGGLVIWVPLTLDERLDFVASQLLEAEARNSPVLDQTR